MYIYTYVHVLYPFIYWWALRFFPCGSDSKESACDAGDPGLIPGLGRFPGEGNGNPLQYPCHGQRSLVGYSPWGLKRWTWLSNQHFHFKLFPDLGYHNYEHKHICWNQCFHILGINTQNFWIIWEPSYYLPQWLRQFTSLTTVQKGSFPFLHVLMDHMISLKCGIWKIKTNNKLKQMNKPNKNKH